MIKVCVAFNDFSIVNSGCRCCPLVTNMTAMFVDIVAMLHFPFFLLVRGLNPYLPLNCSNRSTSTKFGPHVAKVIYFRFFAGAKLGCRRGHHIGQI